MTDPRSSPEFKRLRQEERVIAMLGAILEALKNPVYVVPASPPVTQPKRTRSEK